MPRSKQRNKQSNNNNNNNNNNINTLIQKVNKQKKMMSGNKNMITKN
jgi:hypothetical protein